MKSNKIHQQSIFHYVLILLAGIIFISCEKDVTPELETLIAASFTNNSTLQDTIVTTCYNFNGNTSETELVAYYPFNGNANDESGNENHGTVFGSILTKDRFGNENGAYYFDGMDDEIIVGLSNLDITGDITVCAWFKTNTNKWGALVSNHDQHAPDNGYELCISSLYEQGGFIYFECAKDDIKDRLSTNASFNDDNWHFVAAVLTPDSISRCRIYVDGVEQSGYDHTPSFPLAGVGETPEYPFKIGAASNLSGPEGDANYEGIIDEIIIFKGALNAMEIEALYDEVIL